MQNANSNLSDAEWEAKFNGPRDRLLKKIFGDEACQVKDLSPKVTITDENWESGKDFMASKEPRITNPMNMSFEGVQKINEQLHNGGRIERVMSCEDLQKDVNKAKPEPVK